MTELEAQISECVPLFTSNNDPVGDLQMLLQGLQGELAECLRNRFVCLFVRLWGCVVFKIYGEMHVISRRL